VSSIRLFILGSLAERGPMHGHALLQLAEEEHIDLWTDFAPSAVYGAMKRMAADGLIAEERLEKQGNYPERQVYSISGAGTAALFRLREEGLTEIVIKPDPLDLALTRLDPDRLDELPAMINGRLETLRTTLAQMEEHLPSIAQYLTVAEHHSMSHRISRWRAEVAWHEELLGHLPDIISDEKTRKDPTS
jgi:DNA-binding PadR family transcriptional regulator